MLKITHTTLQIYSNSDAVYSVNQSAQILVFIMYNVMCTTLSTAIRLLAIITSVIAKAFR